MSAEEKPSYEELERRNDSLARQVISYQMRVNESLSSIIRNAKAEALEELAEKMHSRFQKAWVRGEAHKIRNGKPELPGAWKDEGNTK
ncbi:hypothetical protein [Glutamicibacter arilaitensis]|uniref:hypothetical protein n=1 Tax=Glutamicibacter arilaitensis TaxID=256701 RepID=UPI003FCF9EDA